MVLNCCTRRESHQTESWQDTDGALKGWIKEGFMERVLTEVWSKVKWINRSPWSIRGLHRGRGSCCHPQPEAGWELAPWKRNHPTRAVVVEESRQYQTHPTGWSETHSRLLLPPYLQSPLVPTYCKIHQEPTGHRSRSDGQSRQRRMENECRGTSRE